MRIYENVTRAIIEEMERGAVPWVRPWKTDRRGVGSVMPGNPSTGRSYSGINIPILWASANSNGYPSHARDKLADIYPGDIRHIPSARWRDIESATES